MPETLYENYNDRGVLINTGIAAGNKILDPIKKLLLLKVEDGLAADKDTSVLDSKLKGYL